MAQRSGLFDSTSIVETINGFPKGNKAQTADFFASYFASFIGNGVFPNPSTNYQVLSGTGLGVQVRAGKCFINGYFGFDSETETHTFTQCTTDMTYYLVLRLDLANGEISKIWLENPGQVPGDKVPGDFQVPLRTATIHDLVVAKVMIPANASAISDSMITDYRLDNAKCGIVASVVNQIDTTTLYNQMSGVMADAQAFKAAFETTLNTFIAKCESDYNALINHLSVDSATYLDLNKADKVVMNAHAVCSTANAISPKVITLNQFTLTTGAKFTVTFADGIANNDTLKINTSNALTLAKAGGENIMTDDIPKGYTVFIVYNGTSLTVLNPYILSAVPQGYRFYTSNADFTVPNNVYQVKITACASGISPYAGEYIYNQPYGVTPGEVIHLTVGTGNTVIGTLKTLVAGSVTTPYPTTKLGYQTGYNGGRGIETGGYGGIFGFGGGGGGLAGLRPDVHYVYGGGGGAGLGANGEDSNMKVDGTSQGGLGGGTSGGHGARNDYNTYESIDGGNARMGALIYEGGAQVYSVTAGNYHNGAGGKGSVYGAGGGGNGILHETAPVIATVSGSGGAAGGYGAGGGMSYKESSYPNAKNGLDGSPSTGAVLIEWGANL